MKKPDSEAVRARRHRAHSRGDHSLCRAGVCTYVDNDRPPQFSMPAAGSDESVLSAVLEYIDGVPPGRDGGPQIVMARCAVKLAQNIDAGAPGLPSLIRELQHVMSDIADSEDEDMLDEIRSRHHARRTALLEAVGDQESA
ncbi:hypothetical protein ACFO9E_25680 [Streptomyces maoxianensis]|uniref:Uncharacterized protein n=1 Tax=Streptomyces maoxianensis TaxID=1459942 RepID=A0ABV9GA33_9ACTN